MTKRGYDWRPKIEAAAAEEAKKLGYTCQQENRPRARFCEECAAPLARTCANCGSYLSYALMLTAAGEIQQAKAHLTQAIDMFGRMGMDRDLGACGAGAPRAHLR